MSLSRQSVQVDTGGQDEEGCLIFINGRLVAVLVHLSPAHQTPLAGKWFLEHGFGPLDTMDHPVFDDIAAAEAWITGRH